MQAAEFAKIMVPLFKQIAKCLNSSHFQVRWPALAAPWLVAQHWMHALPLDMDRHASLHAYMLLTPASSKQAIQNGASRCTDGKVGYMLRWWQSLCKPLQLKHAEPQFLPCR